MEGDRCQTCGKAPENTQLKRCSRCRNKFYCSIECQKKDWKHHRKQCKTFVVEQQTADWALRELHTLANSVDQNKAIEHFQRSSDQVQSLQLEQTRTKTMKEMIRDPPKVNKSRVQELAKDTTPAQPVETRETTVPLAKCHSFCTMAIEEMKHISRFHIFLAIPDDVQGGKFSLDTKKVSKSSSIIEVHSQKDEQVSTIFQVEIPRLLGDGDLFYDGKKFIQMRIPYLDDLTTGELVQPTPLDDLRTINAVQCGSCGQALLKNTGIIKRTTSLPVGHWDDIADYLICYSGQPIVDFSTASASPDSSVALQDANVLCLNRVDIEETTCVLPTEGYGESKEGSPEDGENNGILDEIDDPAATVRGDRPWRDVSGGATVCCSKCRVPLGFAAIQSPEAHRILKHRLSFRNNAGNLTPLSSCASFVAREMVRYAESKAIFTFIVTLRSPAISFASKVFTRCILLRLVSWDISMATSFQSDNSMRAKFQRFAKIVFEETHDRSTGGKQGMWTWGGVDLCCPPPSSMDLNVEDPAEEDMDKIEPKISTVRIELQQDEYDAVLKSLKNGTNLFTEDIAEATILVKMGPESAAKAGSDLHMTAIALDR